MRRSSIPIVLGLAAPMLIAQCGHKSTYDEEDVCFAASLSPPDNVVAAILRSPEGRAWYDDASSADRLRAKDLLRGQVIHLHNRKESDMLIRGTPPFSGGDNTWFWLFVNAKDRQIATFLQGNSVHISSTRHRGYKDISTKWDVAAQGVTSYYQFKLGRYHLAYTKPHPRPNDR